MENIRGIFIVFEGGEKTGKTTQIIRLKNYLEEKGHTVVSSHEPGGGDPNTRERLLNKKATIAPEEELDLFCEDRRLHVKNIIRPALQNGAIVIVDRFEPSTIAYQGYGRGLNIERVRAKSLEARGTVYPDIIFLLDADPKHLGDRRADIDRFDAEKLEFHQRVRKGFIAQAAEDSLHWRIIDASLPIEAVWEHVRHYLDNLLKEEIYHEKEVA